MTHTQEDPYLGGPVPGDLYLEGPSLGLCTWEDPYPDGPYVGI